jgi:L-ascorbate metabolism protein UlaG (beta-lactamase superfamily)
MSGETFVGMALDDCVYDEDNSDDELVWSFSGNTEIGVTIEDGLVSVELPDPEWLGREDVRFEACDPAGACGSGEAVFWVMERSQARVEVTYVGNAGFMIQVGERKVLIDALVERPAPPRNMADALVLGLPPFDGVDMILATHSHYDHFSAEKVQSYLEHNPETVFVAPQDAASMVEQITDLPGQIIPIRLQQRAGERTYLVANGIGVEAIFLSHGGDILNLGYVVTTEGRRLFHTGDMDPASVSVSALKGLGLPDRGIDIAFVAHFMLSLDENHAHVTDGIVADYIVPMHFQFTAPPPDYELLATHFPDAIVFRTQMESWVLPE